MVFVWSKGTMSREGGEGDLSSGAFTEATLDRWHIAAEQARNEHPAPFPVQLAERLIRLYTWEGDRVLDPFCGVGSSGVAAKLSGRSWVGVDVSQTYCKIARERIAEAEPVAGYELLVDVVSGEPFVLDPETRFLLGTIASEGASGVDPHELAHIDTFLRLPVPSALACRTAYEGRDR